jgi:hypothetical protein
VATLVKQQDQRQQQQQQEERLSQLPVLQLQEAALLRLPATHLACTATAVLPGQLRMLLPQSLL